jgi:vacuolar iron transporter family protein
MDTHLHHHSKPHKEEHLKSSDALRDIVIGMADGLTVPFALAAGLSGAVSSNTIIVIAGIAEIAAGSIAMGLGGYLATIRQKKKESTTRWIISVSGKLKRQKNSLQILV